jgi:DmsE family decaheme c-type cytochrome
MRPAIAGLKVVALVLVATAMVAAQPSIAPALPGVFMMSAHASDAPATPGKAAKADSDYVGSETCAGCHEDQHKRFKNTVMGKVFANPRTAAEKLGCESCHGPGKAHVEAGGGKETIPVRFGKDSKNPVEEQNSACLACHSRGNRMFWSGSPHQSRAVACVDCHQVKQERQTSLSAEARFGAPLTEVKGVKKSQPELCLQCHQMRRAQLQRSSHMPFREGKVTCTSCHNPHGSPNPKQLIQSTVNENCYSCHAERRGPFLWEHPPVLENCGNCHDAHGSTNPQLLKTRTPKLCQQCHNDGQHRSTAYADVMPSAGNGIRAGFNNRVVNRGCANCHARVHGSNHPSGNYFTR